MSNAAEPSSRGFRPLTLITAITSALIALATFDPHFSNLELISFAVRHLLPVATAVLLAAMLVWAIRVKLHLVAWRHRTLSLILLCAVGIATVRIAQGFAFSAHGVRRDDLRAYRHGFPAVRQVGWGYLSNMKRVVSRAAWIADYRQDMAVRAARAFGDFDVGGAQSYLDAGTSSIGGQGGNAEGSRALAYLAAREVYLTNHDARIEALRKQGEVSPLLIYLMRAAYALDPTAEREAALNREMQRDRAVLDQAKAALRACASGQTVQPDLTWPAPLVIRDLAEMTGDWPTVRGDHAGWCRLVKNAAERRRVRSRVGGGEDEDGPTPEDEASQAFDDFANLFWGDLFTLPARVNRAPPSVESMGDSLETTSEPER